MSLGHSLEDGELLMAAMYGDMRKARSLLGVGACVGVRGPNEVLSRDITVWRCLSDSRALQDANDDRWRFQATPLLLAARNGCTPMVQLLVENRASLEARSEPNGATSLLWAAHCGYDGCLMTAASSDD